MKEQTLTNCEQLLKNRDRVKSVFPWDGGLLNLACAGIYAIRGKMADEAILRECKKLLQQKVSVFSNFRSMIRSPIAAILATGHDPDQTLEQGLLAYRLLKKDFWSSPHLPLAAMLIAQMAEPYAYEDVVARTRKIYNQMKKEHPLLTSSEDSTFCALMALSEKEDAALLEDAEQCYRRLKPYFFSSNAVQSLGHTLALCDGDADSKCQKTMELFDGLKKAGCKYGTSYELPTLGVLAMSGGALDEMVQEIIEISAWLAQQRGFGLFSSITRKHRLMYAGIVAQRNYLNAQALESAAINGTISLMIAQQAAMCAAVSASVSAAASSSSSS